MTITEIHIRQFGKLKDFTMEPAVGVNIIYGENEAGKSTVMAFLKAMFYGLGTGEQRRRYEPWEGGRPEGSVVFESDGESFQLSRVFGATRAADKTTLFNRSRGEQVTLPPGTEPGTKILGINVRTFVNTVFIGQAGTSVEGENHEIIRRLTNLTSAGDERISKGEVEKRLKNAAALIDSKKAGAILPELRRQKHEQMEKRMEIMQALERADELRASIEADQKKQASLQREKKFLTDAAARLTRQEELKEIDAVIAARQDLERAQAEFDELDSFFSSGGGEDADAFLQESRRLLEEQNRCQTVLEEKKKQRKALQRQAEGIDAARLKMIRIAQKYQMEIQTAFNRYDSLIKEKNDVEIAMESREEKKTAPEGFGLRVGILAAVLLATVLMGVLVHWIFYVFAGMELVTFLVYFMVSKKDVPVEGFSDDRTSLDNLNEDLRALNTEMRPVFDRFGVRSMEELDREYRAITETQKQYIDIRRRDDELQRDIRASEEELVRIRTGLREGLAPYRETESDEEAYAIVNRLGEMKAKYDRLSSERESARETYRLLCRGRDYDTLVRRGEELRGSFEVEVPESYTGEKVAARLSENESKLQKTGERIIRDETALSLQPYSEQDLDQAVEEIKSLSKRIGHYEFEYDAIREAQNALDEAFREMQLDFGPMINYRAGRVLGGLTGQKYTSVFVSDKLVPTVAESGSSQPRSCDVLSAGTYDQIYLSLRLALAGIVADEKLPVLLDDSFAQFDDKRMEQALAFIREDCEAGELGQTLLFTCHSRVLRAAKKLGMTEGVFSM